MSQSLHAIEVLFATVFNLIDRTDLKDKGMKVWMLSGDFVDMSSHDILIEGLYILKQKLPSDTKILRFDFLNGHILNPMCNVNNLFKDRYGLMFCSSEWEKVKEGEIIPEIQVWFSHRDGNPKNELQCEVSDVEIPNHSTVDYQMCGSSLTMTSLLPILEEINKRETDYVNLNIRGIARDKIKDVVNQISSLNNVSIEEHYRREIRGVNYKITLDNLLDTILSPTSTSKSVIEMAQSIKDEMQKEQ